VKCEESKYGRGESELWSLKMEVWNLEKEVWRRLKQKSDDGSV